MHNDMMGHLLLGDAPLHRQGSDGVTKRQALWCENCCLGVGECGVGGLAILLSGV